MKKIIFFLCLFVSCQLMAQTDEFSQIETKIKENIAKGQWDEVLLLAADLHISNPEKGDGYYYTALAFSKLNQTEKAMEYVTMSEKLADEVLKPKLTELKTAIQAQMTGNKIQSDAEKNEKAGSAEKAAEEWLKLWNLDKSKVEFALNAIELYVQQKKYVQALAILADPVMVKAPETQVLVKRINETPEMRALNGYNQAMKDAKRFVNNESYADAITELNKALGFRPNDMAALELRRTAQDEYAWQNAKKANTFDAYESYLNGTTLKRYRSDAIKTIQNGLVYQGEKAAKEKDISNMDYYLLKYLKQYPSGPDVAKVNAILCDAYYTKAKADALQKTSYAQGSAVTYLEKVNQYCPGKYNLTNELSMARRKQIRYGRPDRTYLAYVYDTTTTIGVSFGASNNRKPGLYITARMSEEYFGEKGYFTVNNARQVEGTSYSDVRFNGKTRTDYGEIILGFTQKLTYPLWIYAGVGVSNKRVLWEMNTYRSNGTFLESNWAKNTDQSKNTLGAEMGCILDLNGLHIRGGGKTADFKTFNYSVGFGFSWK